MIIFMFLNTLNSALLIHLGFGLNTWQWWISMACVWGAYLAGAIKYIMEGANER